MIPRYSLPEIASIWSDAFKFERWLEVEIAVTEAWADIGVVPREDAERIAQNAAIDVEAIGRYIEETHHDVTAFLRSVADSLGEESRWVHYGLTSNDVWDTGTSLQLGAAADVIAGLLGELREAVARQAVEHKGTVCAGRTHGMHAEPTTFGLKLAVWVAEIDRHAERLQAARDTIAVGQMSGPVGTHATVPPEVEEGACRRLGLRVAEVTTQIIQRDRHAHYLSALAGIGASLEKFATEIRGLQRTEIGEVAEPFAAGQTGSSSMPHKRNPELCERVAGLARTLRGYASAGLENVALWHERDISHSSVERIVLPDATGLLAYMLRIFSGVIAGPRCLSGADAPQPRRHAGPRLLAEGAARADRGRPEPRGGVRDRAAALDDRAGRGRPAARPAARRRRGKRAHRRGRADGDLRCRGVPGARR